MTVAPALNQTAADVACTSEKSPCFQSNRVNNVDAFVQHAPARPCSMRLLVRFAVTRRLASRVNRLAKIGPFALRLVTPAFRRRATPVIITLFFFTERG